MFIKALSRDGNWKLKRLALRDRITFSCRSVFWNRFGERVDLLFDPRSVQSMLAGCDDGRAALYECFKKKLSRTAPHLNGVAIEDYYRRFEFTARIAVIWMPPKWQPRASRWLMYTKIILTTDALGHRDWAGRTYD